jgi:hypothetical protein
MLFLSHTRNNATDNAAIEASVAGTSKKPNSNQDAQQAMQSSSSANTAQLRIKVFIQGRAILRLELRIDSSPIALLCPLYSWPFPQALIFFFVIT